MFDLVIANGTLIDGTGAPRRKADVGISGDRITAIGSLEGAESRQVIDASGKIVSPGFIDMHTHSDLTVLYDPHANSKLYDGVTTEVIGNCGIGVAPVNPDTKHLLLDYLGTRMIGSLPVKLDTHWTSFGEYLDYVNAHAPSVNVAPLLAQGCIRIAEMGFETGCASEEQIRRMQRMVTQAMEEGALGLSSGLTYLPGAYTGTRELAEMAKPIRQFGGFYVSHIRGEGDNHFNAVEEAITIAKEAEVPLHISHVKLMARQFFGQTDRLFQRYADAEAEGVELSFDVYPFTYGMSSLASLLPPWVFEGGVSRLLERIQDPELQKQIVYDCNHNIPGWCSTTKEPDVWDYIIISSVFHEESKWLEGLTMREISEKLGLGPYETIFELLRKENGRIQMVQRLTMDEDVEKIIAHPKSMIGSDGMSLSKEGLLSFGKPHPRAFGTHGMVLSRYVREKKLITLENAVQKMTSMPAARLKLDRRGLIQEGYFADVLVFDADTVTCNATYQDPKQYTTGIEKVIVNGKLVLSDGVHQEVFPGRVVGR